MKEIVKRIFLVCSTLLYTLCNANSIELVPLQQPTFSLLLQGNECRDLQPSLKFRRTGCTPAQTCSLIAKNSLTQGTRSSRYSTPQTSETYRSNNNLISYQIPAHQHDLHRMDTEELMQYFIDHNYTEDEILQRQDLFLSPAYLVIAQQLPKYAEYVTKHYNEYKKFNWYTKLAGRAFAFYTPGFQKTFTRLYQECEEKRIIAEVQEQKHRELKIQQKRELQAKKEDAAHKHYIHELQRVKRILSDDLHCKSSRPNYKARLETINIAQQRPERTLRRLQTGQDTLNFAAAHDITAQQITQVMMNAYEHQLHKEFVSHIHNAVWLQKKYTLDDQNIFINALGNGIALGIKSNQSHNPEWAMRWSDFCYEATEIIQGIGEGILLGSYNAVDMIMHPIHTLVRTVDGVRMLGSLTARTIGTLVHWNNLINQGELLQCATEIYSIGEQLFSIAATIKESTAQMSNRDIAKHITAFGTEWVLTGQMFAMGYTLCSNLGHTIKRTIKFLKDEGPAGEFALATTNGMLLKASENMQKGFGDLNNLIRNSNTILEAVYVQYMAVLKKDLESVRLACDNKIKDVARFGNKYLKPEYEHILGIDLYFSRRGIPQINGFHHDFMNIIEKSDVFKFVDKVMYKNGFYKARLFYGENLVKEITFFPSHWSRTQVIEKIYEAYGIFIRSGVEPIIKDNKYFIKVCIEKGVDIAMYITRNGDIKTAYPILEKATNELYKISTKSRF